MKIRLLASSVFLTAALHPAVASAICNKSGLEGAWNLVGSQGTEDEIMPIWCSLQVWGGVPNSRTIHFKIRGTCSAPDVQYPTTGSMTVVIASCSMSGGLKLSHPRKPLEVYHAGAFQGEGTRRTRGQGKMNLYDGDSNSAQATFTLTR